MFDLGLEGGVLITASGRFPANVYIAREKIAAISQKRWAARDIADVSDCIVMPGMVDTHVHLMDPGETDREDFPTGSRAAAIAGVTTLVEHTHAAPVRTVDELRQKRSYLQGRSHVDYGLAAHAWPNDQNLEELWNAGVAFFKAFTCTTHGVPGWDYGSLRQLFAAISKFGGICLVHSEDESITARAEEELRRARRMDGWIVPEWRNKDAEMVALAAVAHLADRAGARIVLAHVSSPDAIEGVERTRSAHSQVYMETCPQYMTLLEHEVIEHGALRKFTPPARARSFHDLKGMWRAVDGGRVDLISSDHAPSTMDQKCQSNIWDAPFGLPGLDTTMPILLNAAACGDISYERVVETYSEMPARVYGLYPRKGSLTVDSDGDLVVVAPRSKRVLADDDIQSKAGWSPYSGRTVVGHAVRTYLRGHLVAHDGKIVEETLGVGKFVAPRSQAMVSPTS
jgi:dihydroorotase (multifunctional complex type)